jgi:hypothetical protein
MGGRVDFDDESLWPLLLVRYVGTPTLEQQEEYQARLSECLHRGEQYVSIIDMRAFEGVPNTQRQRMAQFLREHEPLFRRVAIGTCILLDSPLARLVVSVVFHLKPMPTPYYVASSPRGALDWVLARLAAAGLSEEVARIREDAERAL